MEDPSVPGRQSERPNPELDSTYDYKLPRRLVVCLDGSWNKRDSGTNVYHISNLVQEGRVKDAETGIEWFQFIYYDEGVGTGLLDSVRGGGFGIGLSENVRQAYDWLVEKYRDAKDDRPADEIYVFGFSRGAFTARSLVGLIAKCGLVRRGAPMPPAELWAGYRLLARRGDPALGIQPRHNWWELLTGHSPKIPFRSLWEFKRDDWETGPPRELATPKNLAETFLVDWSRRVRIRCVGIFDTVGTLGVDMLAIPWLRTKTAQFHDTQLSTMVQNGFHALAIDEHRANFAHIPWRRATNANWPGDGKVEQRWFAGAHSNIGGGNDDNVLSQFSLAWILKECRQLGLALRVPATAASDPLATPALALCVPLLLPEKGDKELSDKKPRLGDSFAEIAHGIWKNVVRSKRKYRRIGPPLEMENGKPSQSVNEFVDLSVWQLFVADQKSPKRYNPPNLWAYRQNPNPPDEDIAKELADPPDQPARHPPPRHRYLEGIVPRLWLVGWMASIGYAGWVVGSLIRNRWPIMSFALPIFTFALPIVAWLFDGRESALNYALALEPDGDKAERKRAKMDFYLSWRLFFIGAALLGFVFFIIWATPWLFKIGPLRWLFWLLVLDALMLQFGVSSSWTARPMAEAGLGSIVQLQKAKTRAAVMEVFNQWSRKGVNDRGLLAPVVRTLWRDVYGFIPSYSFLLFIGTWLTLSLFQNPPEHDRLLRVLSQTPSTWLTAFALAFLCALADYVENRCHVSYIKAFPKEPGQGAVTTAVAATGLKYLFFFLGFAATCAATGWFLWQELLLIFWWCQAGGVAFAVVFFTGVLFYLRFKAWTSTA